MPVQEQTTLNQYTANGVTTVFPYQFLLLRSGDVKVELNGVLAAEVTDYAVDNVGNPAGGNIVFVAAPANGVVVVIYRDIPLLRETDYQDAGDFLAATVDADFDRIWMVLQGVRSGVLFNGRPLLLRLQVPLGVSAYVDDPVPNTFLGWNSTGTKIVNVDLPTLTGLAEGKYLQFQDEGINIGNPANSVVLNFTGPAVEALHDVPTKTVTVNVKQAVPDYLNMGFGIT